MTKKIFISLGDSTTLGVGAETIGFVERIKARIQSSNPEYQRNDILFYNLSIDGSNIIKLSKHYKEEITARIRDNAETFVILSSGLNESQVFKNKTRVDIKQFNHYYQEVIDYCLKQGYHLLLLTPISVDEDRTNPWNEECKYLNSIVKSYTKEIIFLAEQNKIPVLDLTTPTNTCEFLQLKSQDGLHPNDEGYQFITRLLVEFIIKNSHLK